MSVFHPPFPPALLALADGTYFLGQSYGASGQITAEVVFNTAQTGYQEILTDPSYAGQAVVFTAPHIGNVGTCANDAESNGVWAPAIIFRDAPLQTSNFRSEESLADYLKRHNTLALIEVDTRQLTRHIRLNGNQNGCMIAKATQIPFTNDEIEAAIATAKAAPSMSGLDLATQVSTPEAYCWNDRQATPSVWSSERQQYRMDKNRAWRVVAYDFGIKHNILRHLVECGCEVHVVPANTPVVTALSYQPHGIFFSNGPGDPAAVLPAIEAARQFIQQKIPLFGICLGHQIIGLAAGAKAIKMKFGHHGANHPVLDLQTGKVFITSQNHGFALDESSFPSDLILTHRSLFDQSCQGVRLNNAPVIGFQGHPEASPGPTEIATLFQQFIDLMTVHAARSAK